MPLRPYQQTAFDRVRASCVELRREAPARPAEVLLVLPTGGGKTRIGAEFPLRAQARGEGSRCLWLAHRQELIDQAARRLTDEGLEVGIVMAGRRGRADAPVQVASVQTLVAREQAPDRIDYVIVDEAHHVAADGYQSIIAAYPQAKAIIGLTATPMRGDGAALNPPFRRLVVACQISELIRDGWLLPYVVIAPPGPSPRETLSEHPVDAYEKHAAGRRAVFFSQFVEESVQWAEEARRRGIEARAVHGGTPDDERAESLLGLKEGRVKLVFNPMVLTEGWDCPGVNVVGIARGCTSMGTYDQTLGRGRRPEFGTAREGERALLIDLRGAFWAHGHPDEDRVYSLDGKGMRRKSQIWECECGAVNDIKDKKCHQCGKPRATPEQRELQRIKDAALQAVTGRDFQNAFHEKHSAWKAMLGEAKGNVKEAMVVFRMVYKHDPYRTFTGMRRTG